MLKKWHHKFRGHRTRSYGVRAPSRCTLFQWASHPKVRAVMPDVMDRINDANLILERLP